MSACLQEKWDDARAGDHGFLGVPQQALVADLPIYQDLAPTQFRFGRWCLVPRARLLLRDGCPVDLGSRAFDLLHLLLSQRGFVVEKTAIVSFVWPNTTVEESNLRFQMATLRKALGEDRNLIKTIPGRGYIFATEYRLAG